jgi:threonine dehydratase
LNRINLVKKIDEFVNIPTLEDIQNAARRIDRYIHNTPVLTSQTFDNQVKSRLFLKCENFQKVGAFKIRGATNAVFTLRDTQMDRGVVTHSSGNHGAAVAMAAMNRGIKAYVVMPENAPKVKINAVRNYGADVLLCEPTLADRECKTDVLISKHGAYLIHPFNDPHVVAGQGTVGLELIGQVPELDTIIGPIGGGGLMSGICIVAKAVNPRIQLFGAEPTGADDAYRSLLSNKRVTHQTPKTIADGLLTILSPLTFSILRDNLTEIITVTDEEIIAAMRFIWERMKIIIEPSSAVPVAAVLKHPQKFSKHRVGIVITGGNVDLTKLPW